MKKYSNKLLSLRAKLNLTQIEMAQKLGVAFVTYNRWENGKIMPTKIHIIQIEELLKTNNIK